MLAIRGRTCTRSGAPSPASGCCRCSVRWRAWGSSTGFRRPAGGGSSSTRLGQRRFVEMVVAGVAVNNVLPGRVGDLLRARWVSRGAYSGGRGLATVMLDRAFDILALVAFLLLSLPLVTDEGWVDRIVVGSVVVLAVISALILAARSYTRRRPQVAAHAPWAAAAFPAGHARGPLRSALGRAGSRLVRDERAAWGAWAVAATLVGRAVGVELSLVDAVFVTAALNLGVAIPSSPGFVGTYQWLGVSALALFGIGREEGLAFAICMQAVWYVPTTIVGAVILVAHAKGAWRSGQVFDFGSSPARSSSRRRRGGAGSGRAGRRGAPRRCGSWRRACGRCSSGGTSPSAASPTAPSRSRRSTGRARAPSGS